MAFKVFNKKTKAFHDRETCQPLAEPLSPPKQVMVGTEEPSPRAFLNSAKMVTGQKTALHSNCCHDPVQIVDKQDPGESIVPLCLDDGGWFPNPQFLLHRNVFQIFRTWKPKTEAALKSLSPTVMEQPGVTVQVDSKLLLPRSFLVDLEASWSALLLTQVKFILLRTLIFADQVSDHFVSLTTATKTSAACSVLSVCETKATGLSLLELLLGQNTIYLATRLRKRDRLTEQISIEVFSITLLKGTFFTMTVLSNQPSVSPSKLLYRRKGVKFM